MRTVDCVFRSRVNNQRPQAVDGPSPAAICLIEGGDLCAERTGYR